MTRRGRCHCGVILTFSPGPQGYKTRCPKCGASVRLRGEPGTAAARGQAISCPCGAMVRGVDKGRKVICPRCYRRLSFAGKLSGVERAQEEATARTQLLDAVEAGLLRFPLPHPRPVSNEVISAAARELPSRIVPSVPRPKKPAYTPVCRVCGKRVPADETCCRACAARPPVQGVLEALAVEPASRAEVAAAPSPSPLPQRGGEGRVRGQTQPQWFSWQVAVVGAVALGMGVAVGGVGVGVLLWLIWR